GQLRSATGADKAGLEQHMSVLDQRIAQLESDIALTGQQLASAPSSFAATEVSTSFMDNLARQIAPLTGVFTVFVLAPLAWAYARRILRRPNALTLPPGWPETVQRPGRTDTA